MTLGAGITIVDVNGDGLLSVLDVVTLALYSLNVLIPIDKEFCRSDINTDGVLNVLDVVTLVDLVLS